jgi:glycosyltransferase involved in cell wall biosynthesis
MLAVVDLIKKLQARRIYRLMRPYFDFSYYTDQYPDVSAVGMDPLMHYITFGWREGRDPRPDFSTAFYLQENPDVRAANINPFAHFIRFGQAEGRNGTKPPVDPEDRNLVTPEFDVAYYRSLFHDQDPPADPIDHFLALGWREGRDPNSWFSTRFYLRHNPDVQDAGINPFVHYLREGMRENRTALPAANTRLIYEEQAKATQPGPYYEAFDPDIGHHREPLAKVLAYYLPQFHAIPENDAFWGEGFTEWRNVARGQPRFKGHVQPRIPRDLGYYTLDDPEVMRRQMAMARAAGLHGFCYYYYWFDGRRVMQKPTEHILADPTLDFPFALMWANENWTRTWDGMEKEVLLKQDYDPAKDTDLVDDLARHFKDPRYICLNGRPLFFIYRPNQIPNAAVTIVRWRGLFESRHGLSPLIMMAQGFGDSDPTLYGLDGAIEFPPHKLSDGLHETVDPTILLDKDFSGSVIPYDNIVARARAETPPDFPLIRTTTPYWDNEARRPGRSTVMQGSTPAKFGGWLKQTIAFARANPVQGEAIIAVNAWNEWAEGAYLEPDVHYGAAYLNALSRAVHDVPSLPAGYRHKLVLVGHDAHRHGAQILVTNLARTMRQQFGLDVVILLCGPGPMVEEYQSLCETHVLTDDPNMTRALVESLAARGFTQAIVNSTVSGWITPVLKNSGFHVTNLIHELGRLIHEYALANAARSIVSHSDRILFPAEVVRDSFLKVTGGTDAEVGLRPQGLYNRDLLTTRRQDGGIRAELGLPADAKIVINVGYADLRKGFDKFVATGRALCETRKDTWFVWLGGIAQDVELWFMPDVLSGEHADRFRFVGHVRDVERWYAAADVFFLSAREDPFPSVVLEALAVGMPVVGFAGTGGCDTLIERYGTLVGKADPVAAARALDTLLNKPAPAREQAAAKSREEIAQNYLFDNYAHGLLRTSQGMTPARVSVIVPNYNYAHCLEERLLTIFQQSYPVFEIIVLDDASNDDSVEIIERIARTEGRHIELLVNKENSGSPFKQWRRGLDQARGDYIWIAEADDISAPDFLSTLMGAMLHEDAALGFTDSWQIDENGQPLGDSYKGYVNTIHGGGFDESFTLDGQDFLRRYLAVKNIILNVSSVVFRKEALEAAMTQAGSDLDALRVAGDWRLYTEICAAGGTVVYEAQALNGHRRHASSVTHALDAERHLTEIAEMQAYAHSRAALDTDTVRAQKIHLDEARAALAKS